MYWMQKPTSSQWGEERRGVTWFHLYFSLRIRCAAKFYPFLQLLESLSIYKFCKFCENVKHPVYLISYMQIKTERWIQAFETKCLRKQFWISYTKNTSSTDLYDMQSPPLRTIKKTTCSGETAQTGLVLPFFLAQLFIKNCPPRLHGRMPLRQRKNWMEEVEEWTGHFMQGLLSPALTTANGHGWHTLAVCCN